MEERRESDLGIEGLAFLGIVRAALVSRAPLTNMGCTSSGPSSGGSDWRFNLAAIPQVLGRCDLVQTAGPDNGAVASVAP